MRWSKERSGEKIRKRAHGGEKNTIICATGCKEYNDVKPETLFTLSQPCTLGTRRTCCTPRGVVSPTFRRCTTLSPPYVRETTAKKLGIPARTFLIRSFAKSF